MDCKKNSILLVDDNLVDLKLITKYLTDSGFHPRSVTSAELAWSYLMECSSNICLVILDWIMPEMDGIELLKKMKQDEILQNIPVVMYTSKSLPEDMVQGMNAGASFYLTKPVDRDVLLSIVRAALRQCSRMDKVVKTAEQHVKIYRDTTYKAIERERQAKFDLETIKIFFEFFLKSFSCMEYSELAELLLDAAKRFKFESLGSQTSDHLRCTIHLKAGEEINVTDRGTTSNTDELILQKALNSDQIIISGSYTAVPAKSGKCSILIRNTPEDPEEAQKARNIISLLLERFDERLRHLEQDLEVINQKQDLEKKNDQIKSVVHSCSQEFRQINEKYQNMKEQQMELLQEVSETVLSDITSLNSMQQKEIKDSIGREIMKSMNLYGEDHITDQKFLVTIQKLNKLFPELHQAQETKGPTSFGGTTQDAIDDLLASLIS